MTQILSEQNIDFEFFDSLSPTDLDKVLFENTPYHLSKEAVATFETHKAVLNKIKDDNNFTIILEDDATPTSKEVIKEIEYLVSTDLDWDIIFLGWTPKSIIEKKIVNQSFLKIRKFIGMHAYIVNPKSVDKVLTQLGESNDHIDKRVSVVGQLNKLNTLFSTKKLFIQNTKFVTQIPKKKT